MTARVDGAGAPLVATGSKIGSRIEDYLEKFSVQPLLKSLAGAVVRSQPDDPVSFIISELKHWKTPQLALVGKTSSGKSTQAALLSAKLGCTAISLDELVRLEVASGSELGQQLQHMEASDSALPDDVVAKLVGARTAQDDVQHNGWVLVGMPSSASQAAALASAGIKPTATIHLNVPDEVAEERCAGRVVDAQGRRWHTVAFPPPAAAAVAPLARDAPESVRARLRTYAPLAGATCDVDGGQAPLDVFKDVLKAAC